MLKILIRPKRGTLLVRPCQTQETVPGGAILIPESSRQQFAAYQVDVLAVGQPEFCEDEDCGRPHERGEWVSEWDSFPRTDLVHPIDPRLCPGAWALVSPRSYIPTDEPDVFLVKVDDVVAVIGEEEA